MDDLMCENIMN